MSFVPRRQYIAVALVGMIALAAFYDLDARTWSLIRTTLQLAMGVVGISVPVGTLLAILIHRTDVRGKRLTWSVLFALLFVPLYLQAAGWDAWFGQSGWWPAQTSLLGRLGAAIWIHAAAAVPWVVMIVGAGLRRVAPELEEAALLDMTPLGVLIQVTLPLSKPAVLIAAWWVVAMVAGDMTVTDLYQIRTFAEEVYTTIPLLDPGSGLQMGGAMGGRPFPGGTGVPLLPASDSTGEATLPRGTWFIVAALLAPWLILGKSVVYSYPPTPRGPLVLGLGAWRIPLTVGLVVVLAALVLVPAANLCLDAGTRLDRSAAASLQWHWSWEQFFTVVLKSPWIFRREIAWTGLISGLAGVLSVAIAMGLVWGAGRPSWRSWLALGVASLSAALPGPVVALAVIRCLNRDGVEILHWLYDRTIFAPVLAATVRSLPVAMLITWWGSLTIAPEYWDLARLDGLRLHQQLWHVARPLCGGTLLVAWCAAMAVAAGDLAATLLVSPPGVSTLATRIFGLLHAGVDDQVAGICLANAILCVLLALIARRGIHPSWER